MWWGVRWGGVGGRGCYTKGVQNDIDSSEEEDNHQEEEDEEEWDQTNVAKIDKKYVKIKSKDNNTK